MFAMSVSLLPEVRVIPAPSVVSQESGGGSAANAAAQLTKTQIEIEQICFFMLRVKFLALPERSALAPEMG
jgi:hypothetical protein